MVGIQKRIIKSQLEKNKTSKLFTEIVRLNSIQRSIEKFLEKWTRKKLNKLETAQHSESREKVINFSRWTNRFVAVGASTLVLIGYPKIGGVIGLFCPLFEALFFNLREKNEIRKREWGEFVKDCEFLGDNLDELTLIIESFKSFSIGNLKLTNCLEKIGEKIYDFLKEYDKNKDKKIDVSELKIDEFAQKLKEEWGRNNRIKKTNSKSSKGKKKILREIVWLMKNFQKEINEI